MSFRSLYDMLIIQKQCWAEVYKNLKRYNWYVTSLLNLKPATNIQLRQSFGASPHSTSSTFDQSNGLTAAVSRHHSTVATPTSEVKLHISGQLKWYNWYVKFNSKLLPLFTSTIHITHMHSEIVFLVEKKLHVIFHVSAPRKVTFMTLTLHTHKQNLFVQHSSKNV